MSYLLWEYYWKNDVDRFRRLLGPSGPGSHAVSRSPAVGYGGGHLGASPSGPGISPRTANKSRRSTGHPQGHARTRDGASGLSRNEVNSRDHAGLTILLRAASSTDVNAHEFVEALIEHPAIDLYAQDPESGWNALHRALYAGSITIARLLLAKERSDLTNPALPSVSKIGQLIKTKDHEGNSPFDLYNSTITTRTLNKAREQGRLDQDSESSDDEDQVTQLSSSLSFGSKHAAEGSEIYVFGSNKNFSLGVGDEDDRQFPERIWLQRSDELLHRFYRSYVEEHDLDSPVSAPDLDDVPVLIRNCPIVIHDVVMSKLHTAILTTDPVSNLYVCGVGRAGRLGLGNENTQFRFVPVQGPFTDRKVRQVALGQNHTIAVAGNGELWTWGLNSDSQLGYALPPPARADEEPMSLTPRQVFGTLKKEIIHGVAASAIHSVAHTGSALYCWGRNVGQLALMDADSRSLDIQQTPRKVAASLLSAPIQMVSAIDKATTCLLANHTVWVFTNYGYNFVKFPAPDFLTNHSLVASSFSKRHESRWRDIQYITSGGETIAAVTTSGDLYTMHLNQAVDEHQPAGSTTNPVKIKGAVTQPRCVWDSRKDGVTSVSVGEHGSVILCTESGAIWKRVKRAKGKAAGFSGAQDAKKNDFKFQRVPYITGCVNVRSSTFGAFAAVRKDNNIMSHEIGTMEQSLWEDVGSLLCLRSFEAAEPPTDAKASRKNWDAAIAREKPGSLSREILGAADIEKELCQWLQTYAFEHTNLDVEVRTTTASDVRIPIHGWLLAGRSGALREVFASARRRRTDATYSDIFLMESLNGKRVLTFVGLDILTLLNLVVYIYQDTIIPVWRYTRDAPSEAYRFRQVRSELMKMATRLRMPKLEAAARLQTGVERSLDVDMKEAVFDRTYFEDGDVIVQLDGADVKVHSQLVCQRCPFFQGMFHGRSQGQWLSQRRSDASAAEHVKIDLKHMRVDTFKYVLQHLYADVGAEMFSEVATPTIDDFSELVLDVMSAANELMLDRLSQICQSVLGRFVTTRNIANLLNEISPCSVTEFKDAGLEYICLQLECMLENHLLDNLDDDLLQDLDQVVRDNQLARFPIARSGRAELLLHEKYPDLMIDIEEERRRRVKEMAFRLALRDDDRKLSSSQKMRLSSLDEAMGSMQTPDSSRRPSKPGRLDQLSPTLRPKISQGDMIFNMDEEYSGANSTSLAGISSREPRQDVDVESMPRLPETWRNGKGKAVADIDRPSPSSSSLAQLAGHGLMQGMGETSPMTETPARKASGPWASPMSTSKLDLKNIMSEASTKSNLTAGLAMQAAKGTSLGKTPVKMSQKERKKQLQMQAGAEAAAQVEKPKSAPWEAAGAAHRPSPWKAAAPVAASPVQITASPPPKPQESASLVKAKPLVVPDAESLSKQRRTASPDTRFPGQGRTTSSPAVPIGPASREPTKPLVPHSKSYMRPARKAEPLLGASMADIIGQQKREQELVKEAVAKRSLQEIQQEQAFQEWWDQESRRAQEEEARRTAKGQDKGAPGNVRRGRRGRGGGKGKGGEAAGPAAAAAEGSKGSGGSHRGRSGAKGKGNKA